MSTAWQKQIIVLQLSVLAIFIPNYSLAACPSFLYSYQIPKVKKLLNIKRSQIGIFVLTKTGDWQRQPLQVNKVDRFGNIDFESDDHKLDGLLNQFDRIAFSTRKFSNHRWQKKVTLPCRSQSGYEIKSGLVYGYLFVCEKDLSPLPYLVKYDEKSRTVSGGEYEYIHDEYNHLSFKSISIKTGTSEEGIPQFLEVARNAEQLIRADVKNFFTLRFGASDVSAKLNKQIPGELGLLGLLQFYLKILFFRIELALTPEVQFYPQSLYMPMSLHSPVEAKNYLNQGSGIFYSWQIPPKVNWNFDEAKLPRFRNKSEFHSDLKQFCRGRRCQFGISGQASGQHFAIDFGIDRKLVMLNFYPQLIQDFNLVNKVFDEKISATPQDRFGVFFETSGLPKGDHYWDFWISFGNKPKRCPTRVRFKPLPIG